MVSKFRRYRYTLIMKYINTFILCLLISFVQAQDFTLRITDPTTSIQPDQAVEFGNYYFVPIYSTPPHYISITDSSNAFYALGNILSNKSPKEKKIIRIDTSGSYSIFHADTFDSNHNILDLKLFKRDTCVEIIGLCKHKSNQKKYLFSIRIDKHFNVLSKMSSFIPDNEVNDIYKIMENYPGKRYIALGVSTDTTYYTRLSFAEVDSNLNVLQFRNLHQLNFPALLAKIVEFENFIYIAPVTHLSIYKIAKNSFNIIDTLHIPNFSETIPNGLSFYHYNDSSFITPEIWKSLQIPPDSIDGITLYRRFIDGSVVDTMKFFNYDTSQMAGYNCMDKYHPDSMFFVGTYNNSTRKLFGSHNTWVMISSIDIEKNKVHWIKYYGGDTYYYTFNVLATSDGGCLVTAGAYDWFLNPTAKEFDLVVLKIDAKGNIVSAPENKCQGHVMSFTLYPNPVQDKIRIRNDRNADIHAISYHIIDMQGKTLLQHGLDFSSSEITIDTQSLKPGAYIILIKNENKILLRSKFIKK